MGCLRQNSLPRYIANPIDYPPAPAHGFSLPVDLPTSRTLRCAPSQRPSVGSGLRYYARRCCFVSTHAVRRQGVADAMLPAPLDIASRRRLSSTTISSLSSLKRRLVRAQPITASTEDDGLTVRHACQGAAVAVEAVASRNRCHCHPLSCLRDSYYHSSPP